MFLPTKESYHFKLVQDRDSKIFIKLGKGMNFRSSKLGPVQLTFTSDGGVAQRGFRVTYQIIRPDPCLEEPCQNGAECSQVIP